MHPDPIGSTSIFVRPRTFDLTVALSSLGSEFEPLGDVLDEQFPGLIIDAGGYIGTASLKFRKMFPRAQIVTVEASPENFAILKKNIEGIKGIMPLNRALTSTSGERIGILDRGTGHWGFTIVDKTAFGSKVAAASEISTVETINIPDILAAFPEKEAGLIKLDIEGAEKDLFENCSADLDRIRIIAVELHDKIVAGCRKSFEEYSRNHDVTALPGEKILAVRQNTAS